MTIPRVVRAMEPIAALHTAARRYCISLVPGLGTRAGEVEYNNPGGESEEPGWDGGASREAHRREELLPAILREIERKTPGDFTSAGYEWIIYCDHEERITLAGDPLVRTVRDVWADSARYEGESYVQA